jgi:chemotaxis methyl-accepting protein methylase
VTEHLETGPWDLVLWRNVSIYLRVDLAERITAGIVDRLRPGGYLVVGRAERPPAGLPLTWVCRCIYRKDVHGA